jgi:hypothetical protein
MSKKKKPGDYEVGYGKPPKDTQFQKGASGNLKGRPKKARDFDNELLREAESFITINDNGQPRRISKIEGVVKQLTNKALTGNIQATRIYLDHYRQAHETVTLVVPPQSGNSGKYDDVKYLSDEELMRIAAGGLEKNGTWKWKGTCIEYGMNRPSCSAVGAAGDAPVPGRHGGFGDGGVGGQMTARRK